MEEKKKKQLSKGFIENQYGKKDKEKARLENSKGGKATAQLLRERGQFKTIMEHVIHNKYPQNDVKNGCLFNHKLLNSEPKKLRRLFKDYLSDKLNSLASNNKTYKENIINRMTNLLLNEDTSNFEFLKAFDMALEIIGEKETDKTIIIQQQESEVNIDKLKELKELLNGDKK